MVKPHTGSNLRRAWLAPPLLAAALALSACAAPGRMAGPPAEPIGSVQVTSSNRSIVLARLQPMVQARLRQELGAGRGGARLTVVLNEVDLPTYEELTERTDVLGDTLWGSITLTGADGRVLLRRDQILGERIRLPGDRSYGVPTDARLAGIAAAFARSVEQSLGS